ncbi:MAG: hypothetical protein H0U64_09030 [Gemmatimonadaceae bacterium]|nr:hypothetical protein [Gemmatimonadaceae bacterium]
MTPTSATKGDIEQASELLAVISRRASHEVRNALNSVAVNLEVVRTRIARPEPDLSELRNFAERASKESDAAASLTTGLADLTRLLALAATGDGKATVKLGTDSKIVSVPLCSAGDVELSGDLRALSARMGVSIRLDGSTVIFTVRD